MLERKFQELGTAVEAIDPAIKRPVEYAKIDRLIVQIKRLIFSERGIGLTQEIFSQSVESILRSFRERYKDLLERLGIHICPTRKLIYRKRKWRRKKRSSFGDNGRGQSLLPKKKVYCEECQQYHYV